MFPDLIALLFYSIEFGRKAHLSTGSRSDHQALNNFYDELTSLSDSLVEAYQGRHGKITIPVCDPGVAQPDTLSTLREHLAMIEAVRFTAISKEDTPLQSLVDDICVLYLSTIYQLAELK